MTSLPEFLENDAPSGDSFRPTRGRSSPRSPADVCFHSTGSKEVAMKPTAVGVVIAVTAALSGLVIMAAESIPFDWPQWGQNPQHQGFAKVAGQTITTQ